METPRSGKVTIAGSCLGCKDPALKKISMRQLYLSPGYHRLFLPCENDDKRSSHRHFASGQSQSPKVKVIHRPVEMALFSRNEHTPLTARHVPMNTTNLKVIPIHDWPHTDGGVEIDSNRIKNLVGPLG